MPKFYVELKDHAPDAKYLNEQFEMWGYEFISITFVGQSVGKMLFQIYYRVHEEEDDN